MAMEAQTAAMRRRRIIILLSSIVLYVFTVMLGTFRGFTDTLQTWHGFYALLVPQGQALASVEASLLAGGIKDFVSEGSARIDIGTYGGMERLDLATAKNRLRPDDPRHSAWIELAGKLFRDESGEYRIIYIYQQEPLASLSLKIQQAFEPAGVPWQIVEWNPRERFVLGGLILAAGVASVILSRGIRWPMLAAIIPWGMVALGFGPRLFPLFALLLLALSLLAEKLKIEMHRFVVERLPEHFFWEILHQPRQAWAALREMLRFASNPGLWWALAFYAGVSLVVIVLCIVSGDGIGAGGVVLLVMVCWPAILVWLSYRYHARTAQNEHRLFFPVPIMRQHHPRGIWFALRLGVLGLFAVAIPGLFAFSDGPIKGASIPVPERTAEPMALTMENLARVYRGKGTPLPDLAVMVNHRLLQESLAWERPGAGDADARKGLFGRRWEAVRAPGGGQAARSEVVLEANDVWLARYRASVSPFSLEGILFSQDQASGLAYSSRHGVYSVDIWSVSGILAFGLLAVLSVCIRRRPGFIPVNGRQLPWGKKSPV